MTILVISDTFIEVSCGKKPGHRTELDRSERVRRRRVVLAQQRSRALGWRSAERV